MGQNIKQSRKSKMKKTSDDMEKLKLEIAEEIGLLDKVKSQGWAGLSAAESGRIGGLLIQRKKRQGSFTQA